MKQVYIHDVYSNKMYIQTSVHSNKMYIHIHFMKHVYKQ